jgi:hypothetical protein
MTNSSRREAAKLTNAPASGWPRNNNSAGQGTGRKKRKLPAKARPHKPKGSSRSSTGSAANKVSLLIVEDFTARALADPRVNWERKGVKRGGTV